MATIPVSSMTVQEYLNSSFEPDMEFVDGHLEERNEGEIEHSELIAVLLAWFMQHASEWQIRVLPAVRIQVSPTRFRLPDLALCPRSNHEKKIVREAPLVVVQVLSPEDRISRYQQRILDYRSMGVKAIWVIDPETRRGWDCSNGSWIEATKFRLEPIYLDLPQLLASLDPTP